MKYNRKFRSDPSSFISVSISGAVTPPSSIRSLVSMYFSADMIITDQKYIQPGVLILISR